MTLYKRFSRWRLYNIFFRLSELKSISSQKFIDHLLWFDYSKSKFFSSNAITTDVHNTSRYMSELAQCNNYQKTFNIFYTFKNELTINNLIATLYHLYKITNNKYQPSNSINRININYNGKYWKDSIIGDYSGLNVGKYSKGGLLKFPKEISDIYSVIKSRIQRFNTRQLLFLAHSTKLLGLPHSKEIQRHVSDMIVDQLWVLELIDFIRAGDSLLVIDGNKSDLEFSKLYLHVSLTKYRGSITDPSALEFELFKIITKCNCIAPILLKDLYSDIQVRIKDYSQDVLVYILTKYSQFNYKNPSLIIQILGLLESAIANLDVDSICDLVWSASKLYNRTNISELPFVILDGLKGSVKQILNDIAPNRLAMLIWAYSTTVPDDELMKSFLDRAMQVYDLMDPNGLSNTLYGLSITIPHLSYDLFDRVDSVIIEYIKSFNTIDLATTSLAYCNVNGGSVELHNSIADVVLELGTFISADCLVKIVYTYGVINCCSNVVHGLIYSILERLNQFTTHGLCIVLWGFSIFHIFDNGVWEAILPLIECDKIDSKCELLYPALLEFKLAHPEVLINVVNRLLNLSKCIYFDWQLQQTRNIDSDFYNSVYSVVTDFYGLSEGDTGEINELNIVKGFSLSNIVLDFAFSVNGSVYGVLLFDKSNVTRINQLPLGHSVQRDRLANSILTNQIKKFKTIRVLHTDFQASGIKCIQEQM